MREIKFRAWCEGRMVGMDELCTIIMGDYSALILDILGGDEPGAFLMQYTGLKDKNGKEIYEGDVVSADELVCEVKWGRNAHGWVAEWSENTKGRSSLGKRQPDLGFRSHEVIGNIHENPELLDA